MKINNYYIIRFNDLKEEKQEEIKTDLFKRLTVDLSIKEYLTEVCGSDPFDIDMPDCDRISEHIGGVIECGCNKSAVEFEIGLSL